MGTYFQMYKQFGFYCCEYMDAFFFQIRFAFYLTILVLMIIIAQDICQSLNIIEVD